MSAYCRHIVRPSAYLYTYTQGTLDRWSYISWATREFMQRDQLHICYID